MFPVSGKDLSGAQQTLTEGVEGGEREGEWKRKERRKGERGPKSTELGAGRRVSADQTFPLG